MKKRSPPSRDAGDLRKRAKSRLPRRAPPPPKKISAADARRLVQELEIHRVELEIQNEELRASRHEVELALERYAELFDFAPIGYAVLSDDETINAVNHAGAHLLGLPRSMLLERRFANLVAVRDRSALAGVLHVVRNGGTKMTTELELNVSVEPRTIVRLTASMLSRPEPTFVLAFADITEQRRKSLDLLEAERALRDADARKDEFLAMLSHELRNPLAPIRSSLYVLEHTPPDSEDAVEARKVIERQVMHLTRVVDDLLDVTRITRGKIRLQRTRFDVVPLLKSVVDDHRRVFAEHALQIELRLPSQPIDIDADPTRIVQVISNLLGNARKFTPPAGRVDIDLHRAGAEVELRVRDTGAGIAQDMLGHVFEPFTQGPQTLDRSTGGLGLGLAMVKGLVELHGGSVRIGSGGPDSGTEVIVKLPVAEAKPVTAPAPVAPPTARRRVVVIEDNRDTADGLQRVLRLHGHDVRVANDGPTGLELVRAFRPEVVICDLGLPGIDGYSLATMLRGDKALAPLYLVSLSGYARPEDIRRAAAAGFDRHIAKPPDLDMLERVVAEAAGAHDGGHSPGQS